MAFGHADGESVHVSMQRGATPRQPRQEKAARSVCRPLPPRSRCSPTRYARNAAFHACRRPLDIS